MAIGDVYTAEDCADVHYVDTGDALSLDGVPDRLGMLPDELSR